MQYDQLGGPGAIGQYGGSPYGNGDFYGGGGGYGPDSSYGLLRRRSPAGAGADLALFHSDPLGNDFDTDFKFST